MNIVTNYREHARDLHAGYGVHAPVLDAAGPSAIGDELDDEEVRLAGELCSLITR